MYSKGYVHCRRPPEIWKTCKTRRKSRPGHQCCRSDFIVEINISIYVYRSSERLSLQEHDLSHSKTEERRMR